LENVDIFCGHLEYLGYFMTIWYTFVFIWYIFPDLVSSNKITLAAPNPTEKSWRQKKGINLIMMIAFERQPIASQLFQAKRMQQQQQ
jgi:hypothetical protein